jgi:beta-lactamase regulating signal transducer with metallopeptidase domain
VNELHAIVAAVTWVLGDNHAGFPAAIAQFARTASPVVLDAIWQGAAVALGLFAVLRLSPRMNAAHRFAAWTAGFAAVAALPMLPLVVHLISGSGTATQLTAAGAAPRPWFELDDRWALGIAAVWLIASALRLAELVFHTLRLHTLWKTATPIADSEVPAWLAELFAELPGGRGGAQMCTTQELDRPSVIGFFRPRILIPDWLYARLTPQELRQVVLHELEHLRRHDDWTNLIQKFVLVLFPLSPALAWIERRLCREREMACDESVVTRTQAPRSYAACLAGLAERRMQRDIDRRAEALSLAAWRRRSELVDRVHGILKSKPALQPVAARVLLSVVGVGLLAGSVELARCPQAVGFVSASNSPKQGQQELAQADAVNIDHATYLPAGLTSMNRTPGPHVVQTRAILAPAPGAAAPVTAAATRRDVGRPRVAMESEVAANEMPARAAHETLLKAEMPDAENAGVGKIAEPGARPEPQYIVLTAWEQVQTAPDGARTIADYDNGVPANSTDRGTQQAGAAADDRRTTDAAPQIRVTRLILRISPASAAQETKDVPATDSKDSSGNNSGSKSVRQPAIIPFGNGWLVFQL